MRLLHQFVVTIDRDEGFRLRIEVFISIESDRHYLFDRLIRSFRSLERRGTGDGERNLLLRLSTRTNTQIDRVLLLLLSFPLVLKRISPSFDGEKDDSFSSFRHWLIVTNRFRF